jgi:hypothetical protein
VSFSYRKANFLTTDDPRAASPYDARYMLRKEYDYPWLSDDLPGMVFDQSSGALAIPPNNVLLMIGNTDELLDAVQQANDNGIRTIEAKDGSPLSCYFVRMNVSSI